MTDASGGGSIGEDVYAELNIRSNTGEVVDSSVGKLKTLEQNAVRVSGALESIGKGAAGLAATVSIAATLANRFGLLSGKTQEAADKLAIKRRSLTTLLAVVPLVKIAVSALTVAMAGLGVVAAIQAGKVEAFTAQQQALIGVSRQAAQAVSHASREVAVATGQSFAAVSGAAYTLQSAGLRGAEALAALEVSARGAQIGLGDAAVAASALTVSLRAWGDEGETSASIMDKIHAAAQRGTASAAEYAAQIGLVAPLADELGVSAANTLGVIAELTKGNNSAALSTTALRGALTQIIRPSTQAEEAFKKMGLTAADLQKMIGADLVGGLNELRKRLDASGIAVSTVFADIEGLAAVLQITGQNAAGFAEAQEQVANSAGNLDRAVSVVADTLQNRMAKAGTAVQDMMFAMGNTTLPVVSSAIDGFAVSVAFLADNMDELMIIGSIIAAFGVYAVAAKTRGQRERAAGSFEPHSCRRGSEARSGFEGCGAESRWPGLDRACRNDRRHGVGIPERSQEREVLQGAHRSTHGEDHRGERSTHQCHRFAENVRSRDAASGPRRLMTSPNGWASSAMLHGQTRREAKQRPLSN